MFWKYFRGTVKKPSLWKSLFSFSFSAFALYLLPSFHLYFELTIFMVVSLLAYVLDALLSVVKGLGQQINSLKYSYWTYLSISGLIVAAAIIKRYYYFISPFLFKIVLLIALFPLYREAMLKIYLYLLPRERRQKIWRKIVLGWKKSVSNFFAFRISPKVIFITSLIVFLLSCYAIYSGWVLNSGDIPQFLQVNATVYALILTLSLSIVSGGDYTQISRYYRELYRGPNLLYFLSYLTVIVADILLSSVYFAALSLFMILNSFTFILNLTCQTSSKQIIQRIIKKIQKEIDEGKYKSRLSFKHTFHWDQIQGMRTKSKIEEHASQYEYYLGALYRLAMRAFQNKDEKTFIYSVRAHFKVFRNLLEQKDYESSKGVLSRLVNLWADIQEDQGFSYLILEEIFNDYHLPMPFFVDFKKANMQRFKLLRAFARKSKDKQLLETVLSTMIEILLLHIQKAKYGSTKIEYNKKSTDDYLEFEDTEEFGVLEELFADNWDDIDLDDVREEINIRFESDEKQEFVNSKLEKLISILESNIGE